MWKEFVKNRGITKVSRELGCTRQSIHNWINGVSTVPDNYKKKIVELSDNVVGLGDFFREIED